MERIQHILGYRIKVVEKSGTPLNDLFQLEGLREEDKSGRQDGLPCGQEGEEKKTRCRKICILYESICKICNPEVTKQATIVPPKKNSSVNMEDSARIPKECTEENWRGYKEQRLSYLKTPYPPSSGGWGA